MNLMEMITGASGSPLGQLSKKFNLSESDVGGIVGSLIPALTNGIKKNVSQSGGLESLLGALNKGKHDRYLDDPEAISSNEAVQDGNGILGHLLGSKEVSRELANRTSKKTGIGSDILKKVLPLVAGVTMGALKKQGSNSGILGSLTKKKSSSGLSSLLGLLDADGDNSPIDDILGIASKLF
jgi:hypothetical protein